MPYAEVAVDAPAARFLYSYVVPAEMELAPGHLVLVPFGPRTARGVVVDIVASPAHEATRSVASIVGDFRLSSEQLDIAAFVSRTYLSPPFTALALFLPPGVSRGPVVYFTPVLPGCSPLPPLSPEEETVLRMVREEGRISLRSIAGGRGANPRMRAIASLIEHGLVLRSEQTPRPSAGICTEKVVSLQVDAVEARRVADSLAGTHARRQACAVEMLLSQNGSASLRSLREGCGITTASIASLIARGLVTVSERRVWRETIASRSPVQSRLPSLNPAQQAAWDCMLQRWHCDGPSEFVLFGVTGSGKTELYLRAAQHAIDEGTQVVCLVPEIVLASQTVERFVARFPGRVAVLHSGLTRGQSYDEWDRVRSGACDVVVGARSALFAPLSRPGLFVLDEEHDWAYKQDDVAPRYHARTVAREYARRCGAILLLGSATPDVETFRRAESGAACLLELPDRIGGSPGLPPVEVIDMREELKRGNTRVFSEALSEELAGALQRREQVLLLLNRRGTATMVQCRRCGHVVTCPRCSVALAHHGARGRLVCHRCGFSMSLPGRCPKCRADRLRFLGIGTQGVADEVQANFPGARVLRWDSDVPAGIRGSTHLDDAVHAGEVDVIVGTQMIAKGLDFPGVTLVGVVNADLGLNVPDFRAGERVFQLLCQAAGRAGRGIRPGRVVVQTYQPDHYVIRSAGAQDYRGFYAEEMRYRTEGNYPPFSSFVQLVYAHSDELRCRREAERVAAVLADRSRGTDLRITGPAPAFVWRLRGRYRLQLTVRGTRPVDILTDLVLPSGWVVDAEPAGIA